MQFIAGYSATYKNLYFPIIHSKDRYREVIVIISYAPFWKTLKKKNISQYSLIKDYGFSTGTLDALRKNKSITLNTLHDICMMLDCEITEVVEFKKK